MNNLPQQYIIPTMSGNGLMDHDPILSIDYSTITMNLSATEGADFTVLFKGANTDKSIEPVNFSTIETKDYSTNAFYSGINGVTFTGDEEKIIEFNVNTLVWTSFEIINYVSGNLDVVVTLSNNR